MRPIRPGRSKPERSYSVGTTSRRPQFRSGCGLTSSCAASTRRPRPTVPRSTTEHPTGREDMVKDKEVNARQTARPGQNQQPSASSLPHRPLQIECLVQVLGGIQSDRGYEPRRYEIGTQKKVKRWFETKVHFASAG